MHEAGSPIGRPHTVTGGYLNVSVVETALQRVLSNGTPLFW
jgi:hypothetical protein